MTKYLCIVPSLFFLLTSCNISDPVSDQKTLDNFAAGKKIGNKINQCRANVNPASLGTLDIKVETGNTIELETELKTALTAVPQYARELYFKEFKGNIRVVADPFALCGVNFGKESSSNYIASSESDKVEACWTLTTAAGRSGLTIFLKGTKEAIQHNTVRIFGYVLAQFFTGVKQNLNAKSESDLLVYDPSYVGLTSEKKVLVNNFLKDLGASTTSDYNLNTISYILGKDAPSTITANIAAGKSDLLEGVSMKYRDDESLSAQAIAIRKARFADYVLAESFDSYYCQTSSSGEALSTRDVLRTGFPSVYQTFEQSIAKELINLAANLKYTVEKLAGSVGGQQPTTPAVGARPTSPASQIAGGAGPINPEIPTGSIGTTDPLKRICQGCQGGCCCCNGRCGPGGCGCCGGGSCGGGGCSCGGGCGCCNCGGGAGGGFWA